MIKWDKVTKKNTLKRAQSDILIFSFSVQPVIYLSSFHLCPRRYISFRRKTFLCMHKFQILKVMKTIGDISAAGTLDCSPGAECEISGHCVLGMWEEWRPGQHLEEKPPFYLWRLPAKSCWPLSEPATWGARGLRHFSNPFSVPKSSGLKPLAVKTHTASAFWSPLLLYERCIPFSLRQFCLF